MNLDETNYQFFKHHLFSCFVFNIIQCKQICVGANQQYPNHKKWMKENSLMRK